MSDVVAVDFNSTSQNFFYVDFYASSGISLGGRVIVPALTRASSAVVNFFSFNPVLCFQRLYGKHSHHAGARYEK